MERCRWCGEPIEPTKQGWTHITDSDRLDYPHTSHTYCYVHGTYFAEPKTKLDNLIEFQKCLQHLNVTA